MTEDEGNIDPERGELFSLARTAMHVYYMREAGDRTQTRGRYTQRRDQ